MAIIIENAATVSSTTLLKQSEEKAALWEIFCLVRFDYEWLLPFLWSDRKQPSSFIYGLVLGHKVFGGIKAVKGVLKSQAMISTANAIRNLQEFGGHPVYERTLYVILRLANGAFYEDVVHEEKENEISELRESKFCVSSQDNKQALERAKHRVRRAKKLLENIGINVKYLNPREQSFRRLLRIHTQRFNSTQTEIEN